MLDDGRELLARLGVECVKPGRERGHFRVILGATEAKIEDLRAAARHVAGLSNVSSAKAELGDGDPTFSLVGVVRSGFLGGTENLAFVNYLKPTYDRWGTVTVHVVRDRRHYAGTNVTIALPQHSPVFTNVDFELSDLPVKVTTWGDLELKLTLLEPDQSTAFEIIERVTERLRIYVGGHDMKDDDPAVVGMPGFNRRPRRNEDQDPEAADDEVDSDAETHQSDDEPGEDGPASAPAAT